LPSFRGAGGDSVLMKKQAAEVRISVRIPKDSDLKPRIAAAARTIGGPESLRVAYRWVATYSGDSRNDIVSTPCGDATETLEITSAPTATPSPTPANVSLLNISGRVVVQTNDNVGTGG
jgi:hypothetical protein